MAGKMVLYKIVVLGDGGVGKVSNAEMVNPDFRLTFYSDSFDYTIVPAA
jgi:hypothetical protein